MSKNQTQIDRNLPLFKDLNLSSIEPVSTITPKDIDRSELEVAEFGSGENKTCIEVDFPLIQVNEVAALEAEPPCTKPIYKMSKWWARRRSTVFRQLLLASSLRSPAVENKAAQYSWANMYRRNFRAKGKFKKLHVLDPFMGGGTTVVEAARLGFKVTGVDLNPVAWWVVYNELSQASVEEVEAAGRYVESVLRKGVQKYFLTTGPRSKKDSAEVIYTFWLNHYICADPSCFHITPHLTSSVVAIKSVKVDAISDCVCADCGEVFDLELDEFRMAPGAKFKLGTDEKPFAAIDPMTSTTNCPHCHRKVSTEWLGKQIAKKSRIVSKQVNHQLLISKKWAKGITGKSKKHFGGYWGSNLDADERWFTERAQHLEFIEVRGSVPQDLQFSNFAKKAKKTSEESGSEEGNSGHFVCGGCGRSQDPLEAVKLSGHTTRSFPFMIHGFCNADKQRKIPYGGRFFAVPDFRLLLESFREFSHRSDLKDYVPQDELFYGFQTHHLQGGLQNRGYSHWFKMFNPRQLLINAEILKAIDTAPDSVMSRDTRSLMFGAFQNYLRHNCMFTMWHMRADQLSPLFSNNNYHPKATTVENAPIGAIGVGNFVSFVEAAAKGMQFSRRPYDLRLSRDGEKGKSQKEESEDSIVRDNVELLCASSTDLSKKIGDGSVDLIVTDPPFGDNLNYSELADFFLVWLWKPLQKLFPDVFGGPESPKTLEAVANIARWQGDDEATGKRKADIVYDRLLTLSWKECYRVLKKDGILVFTFHHDKDEAWINVLESLFKAGWLIEATFPVRSDFAKGDQDFGTKKIEFDIVHVCKKRLGDPIEVYWATLRKRIIESVKAKSVVLAQHRLSGLHLADLEVMIRGEVLEQYSSHYGCVKKNLAGDLMSVREILLEAGVIARSLVESEKGERLPQELEPATRIFLSLFAEGTSIEFNAAKKRLRGSGIDLEEFQKNGWISFGRTSGSRVASLVPVPDRWSSLSRKKALDSDLDQAHFAINCCIGGRQLNGEAADWESWVRLNYKTILPSLLPLLKFFEGHHFGADYKQAIGIAYRTLERTLQRIKETDGEFKKASDQMSLFGA